MNVAIKSDRKTDTLCLYFSNKTANRSKQLDMERTVGYSEDGEIASITFQSVSTGVRADDLPHRSAIERALTEYGFVKLAWNQHADWFARDTNREPGSSRAFLPRLLSKIRLPAPVRAGAAILIFAGSAAASVLLSRNLFILDSLFDLTQSLFALVAVMFPTVLGCLISLALVMNIRGQSGP